MLRTKHNRHFFIAKSNTAFFLIFKFFFYQTSANVEVALLRFLWCRWQRTKLMAVHANDPWRKLFLLMGFQGREHWYGPSFSSPEKCNWNIISPLFISPSSLIFMSCSVRCLSLFFFLSTTMDVSFFYLFCISCQRESAAVSHTSTLAIPVENSARDVVSKKKIWRCSKEQTKGFNNEWQQRQWHSRHSFLSYWVKSPFNG